MSVRALNYRLCEIHGHCIHRDFLCVVCHPATPPTKPAPKAPRTVKRSYSTGGRPASYTLTAKERETADLLARGLTCIEIAKQLGVSRSRVNDTVMRARRRIGVDATYELVRYIREQARAGT